jgi:SulP family sulfate permease
MNDTLSLRDPPPEKEPDGNGETVAAAPPARGGREWFFKVVPAFDSLRHYSVASFRFDLLAGLTVAAVAVPQAMAYAMVAGLKPEYGLYTAIVMTAVGALFDSSRQLINGPTNAIAIALLSALAPVPEQDRLQAAILLALLVGLMQTGITLLRLGDLSRYISHSVIVGFTAGAGLLLVLDQLKNLVGIQGQGDVHDHFLVRFWLTFGRAAGINAWAAALGLGSIALVFALRWLKRRLRLALLPELLVTVVAMAGLVWLFDLEKRGVQVVGHVPRALPSFQLPEVHWGQVRLLANSALAIGVLGLLEAIAMAKAIAAQTGQKLDINQQCLSEGLANLSGSLFHCFPGSGSLTRSAINQQAGAVTQWSGVISAGAVAAIVLLFGDLASYVPRAALAGILVLAAFQMVNRHQLLYHWQATRFDRWIVLATAVAAFAINVEYCMLIGVLMSFVFYVPRAGRLHMTELVVTPERVIRERALADPRCDRIRIYSMEGELFFGSAPDLDKHLEEIAKHAAPLTPTPLPQGEKGPGVRVVVLRLKRVRNPDAVCIQLLDAFLEQMNARKVPVLLCGIRPELARVMRKTGLTDRLGVHQLFPEDEAGGAYSSTLQAVRHAYELLKGDVCAICPRRAEEPKEPLYYMI